MMILQFELSCPNGHYKELLTLQAAFQWPRTLAKCGKTQPDKGCLPLMFQHCGFFPIHRTGSTSFSALCLPEIQWPSPLLAATFKALSLTQELLWNLDQTGQQMQGVTIWT